MKKYFLSMVILASLYACNNSQPPAEVVAEPGAATGIADSPKPAPIVKNMGSGLTIEEMQDDSVFADGSVPTSWEIAGFSDVRGFKLFLKELQLLVLNNDKEQMARHIRYPLNRYIRNESEFIKNYDQVFTKDAKLSIAKINFSQIFRNSKGAMSEDGKVWFAQAGNEFKIIAVNN